MTANTAHEEKFYNLTPAERLARITVSTGFQQRMGQY